VEFQFNDSDLSSTPKSSIGSDKLRKAIERNRAKQVKRDGKQTTFNVSGPAKESKLPDEGWSLPRGRSTSVSALRQKRGVATRKSVAKPGDFEFTTNIRKSPRKAPSKVAYARTSSRAVVKVKKKNKKKGPLEIYLLRGVWVFCGFLLLRLFLSEGGVFDYYERLGDYESKERELLSIQNENSELIDEIDKMKKNSKFQKKLVRDHLGFISQDEYLILFP
jgi:cell division protein FtsB